MLRVMLSLMMMMPLLLRGFDAWRRSVRVGPPPRNHTHIYVVTLFASG